MHPLTRVSPVSPPHVVGFANGIAQSIVSLARFCGPVLGGLVRRCFSPLPLGSKTVCLDLVDKCPGTPERLPHWLLDLQRGVPVRGRTQLLDSLGLLQAHS